ncbi:MAG: hypothetical protein ACJ77K_00730 [Bacteroidia bacterium]
MKRIFHSTLVLISAVTALTLNSCKKEEPDTETQSAVDNSLCEGEFTGRMPVINSIAIKEQGVKSMMSAMATMSGQPTIIINPADTLDGFPVTMILDYGTGTTDSIDGKVRKGQVSCKFSNSWDTIGSNITVKLINYWVAKSAGAPWWKYACDSIMIKHTAAYSYTNQIIGGHCNNSAGDVNLDWAATRTLTQTAGMGDYNPYNDVFEFTGNAQGKNREGKHYTVNVTVPVIKKAACTWITQGRIDLTPEGLATRTVDYGDGTCDDKATLTINGNTFQFTMN